MAFDLTRATYQRTATAHDLTKAAQTPKSTGRSTFAQTGARQTPATSAERPLTGRSAKAAGKAMPTRAKTAR